MKVEQGTLSSNEGLANIGRPREFGKKQSNPIRRFGGITIAAILHIVLIWALINGLATKVVHIVAAPIETHIIEPVKPPPPPPPKVVHVVQQQHVAPPPPFVPPPEVQVQTPVAPTISHVAAPAPSAPAVQAPPAPAPVAKPVSHEVGVVCPNSDTLRQSIVYPQEAQENNITGDVTVDFTVDADGHVGGVHITQHADSSLEEAAVSTVKKFHCIGQGQPVHVQVPFSFNLN